MCAVLGAAAPPASARTCEVNINSGGTTFEILIIRLHRITIGAAGFCYDGTEAAVSAAPYFCRMDAQVVNVGNALPPALSAAMINDPIEDYCHAESSALQLSRCSQWYVEAQITAYSTVHDYEDDYPVVCASL